jgi:hypothetical protein
MRRLKNSFVSLAPALALVALFTLASTNLAFAAPPKANIDQLFHSLQSDTDRYAFSYAVHSVDRV